MVSFDGIEYLIDNAQQFWSELEDILKPITHVPTLHELDSTLQRFLDLTVAYHEQYLQSPLQLDHACGLLLDSELFSFHSERMSEILASDVQSVRTVHPSRSSDSPIEYGPSCSVHLLSRSSLPWLSQARNFQIS